MAFPDQGSGLFGDFRSYDHEYYHFHHLPDLPAKGFFIATFDVTAAFFEGSTDCRTFARMPLCLSSIRERVEIVGNWYGLKQDDQLNFILLEVGFIRYPDHPCLYTRLRSIHHYVDDGLMGCNKDSEFDLFLTEFNELVTKSTITRDVLKYTGVDIRVDREARLIELSHSVYILAKIAGESQKLNELIPMSPAVNLRIA